jgi:hypothetical protein
MADDQRDLPFPNVQMNKDKGMPFFKGLVEMREEGCIRSSDNSQSIHPNPRFYKYYWWIFWSESPTEGRDFLTEEHRLSIAPAMQLMNRLGEEKEPHIFINEQWPRLDPVNPFDLNHHRWSSVTNWAPSFDEDPDPEWNGHR